MYGLISWQRQPKTIIPHNKREFVEEEKSGRLIQNDTHTKLDSTENADRVKL
jgi:hypothetical protein